MRHFAEARSEVQTHFRTNAAIRRKINKVCLIWDLQGRLRLLVEPAAGIDSKQLKEELEATLPEMASPFWADELWVWTKENAQSERAVYEKAWNEAARDVVDSGPPEVRSLERHVSKDAWFGAQTAPPWPLGEHTPPVIAFYSFKGGVGRTTALLSLGVQLSRAGHRVAIVDLDLEAPGIRSALPPPSGTGPVCGVIDYLLERPLVKQGKDLDLADFFYTVDSKEIILTGPPIAVVPAGRVDDQYLEKLARLNYERLNALTVRGNEHSPLVDLLTRMRSELKAEYILLDSRAGFHDLGGMALSGIAHLDVLLGLDSEQSWAGIQQVVRFLGRGRIERGLEQLACTLVYGMAPEPGNRDAAFEEFKERAYSVFSEEYYAEEHIDIEDAWTLPDQDAEEQPHFPMALGFDPLVQRYRSFGDVANRLADGDFRTFALGILERLGRRLA